MDLCNRNDIQALLARHGFHFAKALGQNFLIRGDVARISPRRAAFPAAAVLEVGHGALTVQLARRAEKVVSVELDKRLPPVLAETMADYDDFTLIEGDVMALDLAAVTAEQFRGLHAGAVRQPALQHHHPVSPPYRAECFPAADGARSKRGRRADLREAGHERLRRVFPLDAVLHRAGTLFAVPRSASCRSPRSRPPWCAPSCEGSRRSRSRTRSSSGGGVRRVCPAAQDARQQPADRLAAAQGAAGGHRRRLRPVPHRAGRGPGPGGVREAVRCAAGGSG